MSIELLYKIMLVTLYVLIVRATLPRFRIDTFHLTVWKSWIFLLLLLFALTVTVAWVLFL